MTSRILSCTLMLLAAGTGAHAQTFDSFSSRGVGRSIAIVHGAGDWPVHTDYRFDVYGAELEWRRWGARVAVGDVVPSTSGLTAALRTPMNALAAGVDRVIPVGFGIPVVLIVGADFAQAGDPEGAGVREFALPVTLANNATIDFGSIWWHPTIAAGATFYRSTTHGISDNGWRLAAATGLEAGAGRWSVRARLKHNMRPPQSVEVAVRRSF